MLEEAQRLRRWILYEWIVWGGNYTDENGAAMEATSLLSVRKERQIKVALEPKTRGGRRPIIIREENHSRADI